MKIGVITKREKAHKAGSVMQEAAELLRSRGVEVEAIYPEDSRLDVARVEAYCVRPGLRSSIPTRPSSPCATRSSRQKCCNRPTSHCLKPGSRRSLNNWPVC